MRFNEIAKRTGRAVALSAALVAAASFTITPTTAYAQHRGGGGGGGFHGGGFHGGGFHGGGWRGGWHRGGGWGWGWPVAAGLFAGAALASYPYYMVTRMGIRTVTGMATATHITAILTATDCPRQ
jgi:hypothetical protein